MKRVIRVVKAVPWALLGRLGYKGCKLLGKLAITVLVFGLKIFVALAAAKGKKPEVDEDDDLFDVGSYPSRPDLSPFRPK